MGVMRTMAMPAQGREAAAAAFWRASQVSDRQPLAHHLRRTLAFAMPIMVARSAILIMATVDAIMTGWSGARELAYLGLGATPMITLMIVSIGALQSTVVLVSQAVGAGEDETVGDIWRASLAHAAALGLAAFALSLLAEDAYLVAGQDPDIARHGAAVSREFGWGVPGMLLFVTASLTLEAIGHQRVGMAIMLVANLLNVMLNGVFVVGWFGWFEPGGAVAAVATSSALRWLAFVAALAYMLGVLVRAGDRFAILAPARTWFGQWRSLGGAIGQRIRRIGLPMALLQGVESSAFAAVVFLAGFLGADALSAHQATMTILTLVYMNAIGMAGATSIRVGRAVGRANADDVFLAGASGVGLAMALALPFAAFALAAPELLARAFVDDEAVIAIARETMWTIGWLFAFDAMMGAVLGALRGVADIWVPLAVQAAAFWVVAIPVAWTLAIAGDLGPAGLWWGIGTGMIVSLVFLLPRFHVVARRPVARV